MNRGLIRTQQILLTAALSAVSFFGLAACSPQTEKDSWSPGNPVAIREVDGKTVETQLLPLADSSIFADSRITFRNADVRTLKVKSTCKTTKAKSLIDGTTIWLGQATNSVEIRSLLPDSIWKRYAFEGLNEDVTCVFSFDLNNAVGSNWSFTLPAVVITGFETLENFDLKNFASPLIAPSNYDLICDHFSNSQKSVINKPIAEVYQTLAFGSVTDSNSDSSRYRYNHQICRISIETTDLQGNKRRLLSKSFVEQFQKADLEIVASLNLSGGLWAMSTSSKSATVLNVKVKNPSRAHVAIRLKDVDPGNLMVQNFSKTWTDFYQVVEEYPVTLNYSWSGDIKVIVEEINYFKYDRLIEIAPGGTLSLTASVSTPIGCLNDVQTTDYMRWQLPYPHVPIPVGYAYGFRRQRFLERLLNWDPSFPQPESPTEDLNVLYSAGSIDADGVLPGRAILGHWANSTMPQNVKVVKTNFPEFTYCGPAQSVNPSSPFSALGRRR